MSRFELVITPGDPEGIGPEVVRKALKKIRRDLADCSFSIFGSEKALGRIPGACFHEPPPGTSPGFQSGWAIETAVRHVMQDPARRALVTGPIHKGRLQEAGFPYRGHTDFLAALTRTKAVTMMLANERFRVALVTDHCPLSEVPSRITRPALGRAVSHVLEFCRSSLGKKNPKIAVLGLNPHAGEGGLLGPEEKTVLIPAIRGLGLRHPEARITGPHSADSFFAVERARPAKERHDAIVALYHDQGLIPVKLSGFGSTVNLTLGLPIVRTSVDHGTAFDIAGRGTADPGSMIEALKQARHYLKKRSDQ
jgi:4-hydroxythreonine-4-phosphate dehydrogenase